MCGLTFVADSLQVQPLIAFCTRLHQFLVPCKLLYCSKLKECVVSVNSQRLVQSYIWCECHKLYTCHQLNTAKLTLHAICIDIKAAKYLVKYEILDHIGIELYLKSFSVNCFFKWQQILMPHRKVKELFFLRHYVYAGHDGVQFSCLVNLRIDVHALHILQFNTKLNKSMKHLDLTEASSALPLITVIFLLQFCAELYSNQRDHWWGSRVGVVMMIAHINNCTPSLKIQEASAKTGSQFTCNGSLISIRRASLVFEIRSAMQRVQPINQ